MIKTELKLAIREIIGMGKYNELSTTGRILLNKRDYDNNITSHYRIDMLEDTHEIFLYYNPLYLDETVKNELNLIALKVLYTKPDPQYETIDLVYSKDGVITIKKYWNYDQVLYITYQCPHELLAKVSMLNLIKDIEEDKIPCTSIRASDY